jgi:hypothetical protein
MQRLYPSLGHCQVALTRTFLVRLWNDPWQTSKLKSVPLIKKWVDADIIGYIPSGNADTEEGKAAVFNREIAAPGYRSGI